MSHLKPKSLSFRPWLFLLVISFLSPGCLHTGLELCCPRLEQFSSPLPFHCNRVAPLPITQGPASTLQVHRLLENSPRCQGWAPTWPPWPPHIQPPFSLLQELPLSSSLGWRNSVCVPTPTPVSSELSSHPSLSSLHTHPRPDGVDVRTQAQALVRFQFVLLCSHRLLVPCKALHQGFSSSALLTFRGR